MVLLLRDCDLLSEDADGGCDGLLIVVSVGEMRSVSSDVLYANDAEHATLSNCNCN